MRVEFKTSAGLYLEGKGRTYSKGDQVDLPDAVAKDQIKAGHAVEVKATTKKPSTKSEA